MNYLASLPHTLVLYSKSWEELLIALHEHDLFVDNYELAVESIAGGDQ